MRKRCFSPWNDLPRSGGSEPRLCDLVVRGGRQYTKSFKHARPRCYRRLTVAVSRPPHAFPTRLASKAAVQRYESALLDASSDANANFPCLFAHFVGAMFQGERLVERVRGTTRLVNMDLRA